MVGFYKDPQMGYFIGNHQMVNAEELGRGLKNSGAQYTSPLIKEEHVMYALLIGAFCYTYFKLLNNL